jgi:hypothetical protein
MGESGYEWRTAHKLLFELDFGDIDHLMSREELVELLDGLGKAGTLRCLLLSRKRFC